jgi:hypothetical protein
MAGVLTVNIGVWLLANMSVLGRLALRRLTDLKDFHFVGEKIII